MKQNVTLKGTRPRFCQIGTSSTRQFKTMDISELLVLVSPFPLYILIYKGVLRSFVRVYHIRVFFLLDLSLRGASVPPYGSHLSEDQWRNEDNAAPCHNNKEVEHTHPAQFALNQGNQILSHSCPDAPGPIHDACDCGQRLLTAPESVLSAQIGGYG